LSNRAANLRVCASITSLIAAASDVAHGAILRILAKNKLIADQVTTNYRKAYITPLRQMAMLDFAMKVSNLAENICDADFETLQSHGFSDEDIWDIAGITAFIGLSIQLMFEVARSQNDSKQSF
jgi:uncharacterized peroxidase-related enzyme